MTKLEEIIKSRNGKTPAPNKDNFLSLGDFIDYLLTQEHFKEHQIYICVDGHLKHDLALCKEKAGLFNKLSNGLVVLCWDKFVWAMEQGEHKGILVACSRGYAI